MDGRGRTDKVRALTPTLMSGVPPVSTKSRTPIGRRHVLALGAAATLAAPQVARGQARWKPERPITVYNPFAAGGATDIHIRFLAERVTKLLGQQVLVDIKAGAAGTLAPAQIVHAKPDGHMLACMSINSLRYPHYHEVPWHPLRDFTYVTGLSSYTMGIVVRTDAPWQTIEDLIAAGKKEPENYNFGTSGVGGSGQLMMIEVDQATGAKFTHVPYKGSAPAVADVVAGHVDLVFDPLSTQFIKQGKLRALAYFGGARSPDLPNVPSIRDAGVKGWEDSLAGAFFITAPRNVPPEVLAKLRPWIGQILAEPDTVAALSRVQVDVQTLTPEQTSQRIRQVHEIAARVVADRTMQGN